MPMDNVFGIHTKLIKMVGVKIILDISEQFKNIANDRGRQVGRAIFGFQEEMRTTMGVKMEIEIIKSTGTEWYKDCIGKRFKVQSESRKGGRGKYVVRLEKEDRSLMNGYMYGWVDKEHCKEVKPIVYELISGEDYDYLIPIKEQ